MRDPKFEIFILQIYVRLWNSSVRSESDAAVRIFTTIFSKKIISDMSAFRFDSISIMKQDGGLIHIINYLKKCIFRWSFIKY